METTMNTLHPDTTTPAAETPQPNTASRPERRAARPGDDVVRCAEFRLALWIGGFALAVIISSQGLLYSAILDVQGQIADSRGEIGDLRGEIGILRGEMSVLRADLQGQIDELRVDLQRQIDELRLDMQTQFSELRERIVRIETHLGIEAGSE